MDEPWHLPTQEDALELMFRGVVATGRAILSQNSGQRRLTEFKRHWQEGKGIYDDYLRLFR